MDPLDLIIEQLHQSEIEEIEHWCPVCDRLILPSQKLVGPAISSQPPVPLTLGNETTTASTITSHSGNEPPTSTTPTSAQRSTTSSPIFRRKSAQGHGAFRGGGRPTMHRSRTSMLNATIGLQHKRKPDHANRSNPNFVQDFVLSTHGGGAAPRAKTSPIGSTSHSDNAKVDEDFQGESNLVLRTSDRTTDPREALPLTMTPMKRKSSVSDVNAGPRLKPLTKSKFTSKPRPKSLNLVTAKIVESKDVVTPTTSKTLVPSGTPSGPSTAVDPSAVTHPQYKVEDLRRRLYCSEECYNIDLKGEKFDVYRPPSPSYDSPVSGTPPATPPSRQGKRPYEIKRNLSCEMPWLWTNAISRNATPRRMAPTRNPSWLASGEDESSYSEQDRIPSVSERVLLWPPFPQTKTGPLGVPTTRKVAVERRQSKPLQPHEVDALRKMAPAFNGERSPVPIDSPVDRSSSSEFCRVDSARSLPTGAPMRKARPFFEDEKNEHKLFFRRMPSKLDAASATMPPLFVVDGHWTEAPPPGFDYTAFMEKREKERRKRQIEITEAMLLKKNVDAIVGAADDVTRRHHELGRRKKRVDADKSQYERRTRTMHGSGYFNDSQPGRHRQPWWHLDEQEDWKTYWAARDGGLDDVTFEQWQLQRHAERVKRAEREQALRRIEGDRRRVQAEVAGVRVAGDGKKVAKRPLLIRVASQPTVSDVDLVGRLYKEGETRMKQHKERTAERTASFLAARTGSSSSEASPLGMNRTKALPVLKRSVDSKTELEHTASPSSFMRGHTLCIPGFVVEEEVPKKTIEKLQSPRSAGLVFPLVAITGSVLPVPVETVSTPKSPSLRVPPGLALPTSALISPVPKSPLGNPPALARPQPKKSNTLPINTTGSQLADAPSHLSPRRRIQSLKSVTLPLPDLATTEVDDAKRRSSLLIPRSPLGLHSFSAAEIPLPLTLPETHGKTSAQAPSSVGRSSTTTTRSKRAEDTGSHRRTLLPLVINETAIASMSSACAYSSEQSLSLVQKGHGHGLPAADIVMGSPEVVTAVSGLAVEVVVVEKRVLGAVRRMYDHRIAMLPSRSLLRGLSLVWHGAWSSPKSVPNRWNFQAQRAASLAGPNRILTASLMPTPTPALAAQSKVLKLEREGACGGYLGLPNPEGQTQDYDYVPPPPPGWYKFFQVLYSSIIGPCGPSPSNRPPRPCISRHCLALALVQSAINHNSIKAVSITSQRFYIDWFGWLLFTTNTYNAFTLLYNRLYVYLGIASILSPPPPPPGPFPLFWILRPLSLSLGLGSTLIY